MKTKELKIQVPKGYEIDKENSTFECIKFKKKAISFVDIINKYENERSYPVKLLTTSNNHMNKLIAINSLLLVAKYLNKGWIPNFNSYKHRNYYITIRGNKLYIDYCFCINTGAVAYFKKEELAQQAIDILGEEVIKQALSPNY